MKKIICLCALLCISTLLHSQERFFLYGKILGADGIPLPSARISSATLLGAKVQASSQVGPDGSFKLLIVEPELTMLTIAAPAYDSLTLPLLLTTEQHTMSITVHLGGRNLIDSTGHAREAAASVHIKDENTELGIAERLMMAFEEEKRLDSSGVIYAVDRPAQRRDPDSLLAVLSSRIDSEENPMHRDLFLLRYLQVCVNAHREGKPAVIATVLRLLEPSSPFWSLAPDLLRAAAHRFPGFADYETRVKARTHDPELKLWLERMP